MTVSGNLTPVIESTNPPGLLKMYAGCSALTRWLAAQDRTFRDSGKVVSMEIIRRLTLRRQIILL